MVFGGKDPATGYELKDIEFEAVFSWGGFLNARAKVGAAPLTMKFLRDKQVCNQIGDSDDKVNLLMIKFQEANDLSTYLLSQSGYYGSRFKAKSGVVQKKKNVM